jgi:hypothetical protein
MAATEDVRCGFLIWAGQSRIPKVFRREDPNFQSHEEGLAMKHEIDCVARAFYAAEHDEAAWDCASEIVKEEFRRLARAALAILAQHRGEESSGPGAGAFPYAA